MFMAAMAAMEADEAKAIEWKVTNQSTIAWDAVIETTEGNPFPAGDEILYGVYIVEEGKPKADAIKLDETDQLEYTITFASEGRWLTGVETIRIPAASPADRQLSSISWSDSTDVVAVPTPFGFVYFAAPKSVGGLGPKQ
jgi:hypothetical protein